MHLTALTCPLALIAFWVGYRAPTGRKSKSRIGLYFQIPRGEFGLVCYAGIVWAFYNIAYFSYLSFG